MLPLGETGEMGYVGSLCIIFYNCIESRLNLKSVDIFFFKYTIS